MKKFTLCVASAITMMCSAAQAQEAAPYETWVGGFAQYYSADSDKHEPIGGLDDGRGFGAEVGFRFDPSWAIRFEVGRLLIDKSSSVPLALADDGTQIGADMMYFLEDDLAYLFGGLREQSLQANSYRMGNVGVGKHWEVADNWRVITELAGYHDFGQGYKEMGLKLGVAYVFGTNKTTQNPDSDNDGVYDAVDRCPNTPAGTQVDATGCNIDMDGDGVLNAQDQCPTTKPGVRVDENGCAFKDADNDGVVDANDKCPNTKPGAEVDAMGCADSDNDGVIDMNDSCPNTPAGTKVNVKGCAVDLDLDSDGVLDSQDKCLGTPMTDKVDADGCSIFEQNEVSISLDILFANNSSVVSNPDSPRIQEVAEFMNRFPNTQAVVEGHSSAVGEASYNQFLSEKRAQAVRTLLIEDYGIDADRLEAVGYGESRLKDSSNTAEAHRVNRRIEMKVTATVEVKATR